jgi:Putative auto-transporter adhesin, head GIN domain
VRGRRRGPSFFRMLPAPRLLLIPAALVIVALAGCSVHDDGPRRSQTRDLAAFTRIDTRASADLNVHVGEPQRVQVRAGRKVVGDVHTEVHDGALEVTFDHHGLWPSDVVVDVSVPRLTAIATSGSGDVNADGIAGGAFAVRSNGSADLSLAGAARRVTLEADGSGNADLGALQAREARVSVGGSGDVDVRADRRLDVWVDGSGDVRYHGHPALTRHVDGSGDVSRAD